MPNCPRCQKPVYFAERVTSIGFDWHRPCLRCENEACKKTLAAGSHSEREGKPYCNRCYGAMFGPRGYGHGGVESHTFHQGQTTGQSSTSSSTPLSPIQPHTIRNSRILVPSRHIVTYY